MMKAIKRLFQLIILLPIGILLVSLAVANRHDVRLALDPFSPQDPVIAIDLPLFWIVFASLLLGILLGGIMDWFKQGRHRREAKQQRFEAQKWRGEADRQQQRVEKMVGETGLDMPALPAPAAKTDVARPAA